MFNDFVRRKGQSSLSMEVQCPYFGKIGKIADIRQADGGQSGRYTDDF